MSVNEERPEDDGISVAELMAVAWAQKWRIASGTFAFLVLAVAVFFLTSPIYRTETVLAPVGQDKGLGSLASSSSGSLGGLASLAGISLGGRGSPTDEAIAVLRSREFIERFIEDEHLLPILFSSKWDSERNSWRDGLTQPPTLARGYRQFDERILSVNQDRKSGLVTVSVTWKEPQRVANWANTLVARLNSEMRERASREADESIRYLEKERESTLLNETRDAINRLLEAQIRQRMLASVTEDFVFRVLDHALPPDPDEQMYMPKILRSAAIVFLGFVGCVVAVVALRITRRTAKAGT